MLIVALTHTLRGNCSVCWLLRWSRASISPRASLTWTQQDVCFYPFRKRRSAQHEQKRPVHPWLLLHDRMKILASSQQHTNTAMLSLFLLAHAADSNCATHFSWAASFRLIWIFMNVVRRPHSIIWEIAWHGAPNPFTLLTSVWGPCTSSDCSLYFAVPGCHQCVASVMEKNERQKTAWAASGKQSSKKNKKQKKQINAEERWMAFSRLQN